jgi:hypothetical protein
LPFRPDESVEFERFGAYVITDDRNGGRPNRSGVNGQPCSSPAHGGEGVFSKRNFNCADRERYLGAAGTAQSTDTDLCHFKVKFIALITVHLTRSPAYQNFARQMMTAGIFAERSELPGGE